MSSFRLPHISSTTAVAAAAARRNENNDPTLTRAQTMAAARIRNPTSRINKMGDLKVASYKHLHLHPPTQRRQPLTTNRQPAGHLLPNNKQYPHIANYRRGPSAHSRAPTVITNKDNTETYTKLKFLGEGGFAKCYKVQSPEGQIFAAKVISKSTLQDTKTRMRLFSEISIHRSMNHRSIVRFHSCFEDTRNVYLILELCDNNTLVEMLRSRSRLTEPEVRFFLIQILDACRYMHDNRVIHRDIKLSNAFLDKNMNVKMGDFGLAAILVDRSDRKRTICGTPNYIAPEILFKKEGHNHKVDTWSIGVLMFTLLAGKPPFQQNDVKHIYKKIKANWKKPSYELPSYLGDDAKDLIEKLLINNPRRRLSVPQILSHDFFQKGLLPSKIPIAALHRIPSDEELYPTTQPHNVMASPGRAGEALRDAIDANISYVDHRLIDELKIMSEVIRDHREMFPGRPVDKENAVPGKTEPEKDQSRKASSSEASPSTSESLKKRRPPAVEDQPRKRRNVEPTKTETEASIPPSPSPTPVAPKTREKSKVSILETMARALRESLEEAKNKDATTCQEIHDTEWSHSNVFMDKWVDYTSRYGLCYSLMDGTIGVSFLDSTTLLKKDDDYQYIVHEPLPIKKESYHANNIPDEFKKKLYLMSKFNSHMETNLARLADNMPEPAKASNSWVYISKFIVTERAAIFRLSNGVIQFTFFNHTKLILTACATRLVYISKERQLKMYALEDAVTTDDEFLKSALEFAHDILDEQIVARNRMYGS
ncbi:kinase-like domain-containing protein [Zychaea mexicana]|uniref:kinase-like domain-containing protein n=1 Tax=Zychaea mexicana TaxID=64656 RepID=UPI0022FED9EE|nr:kinase-like domain-containing protein [Zychaea mexicana]KAI9490457.1 kinase-like domain-containing protein [Zychaea mexicana]